LKTIKTLLRQYYQHFDFTYSCQPCWLSLKR